MSAAKHTPGPLFAGAREVTTIVRGSPEGMVLYRGQPRFTEGDARLYAAAPELLEALATLTNHCRRMGFDTREEEPLLQAAEAAIAKATGGMT